jgi:hypothetical protein
MRPVAAAAAEGDSYTGGAWTPRLPELGQPTPDALDDRDHRKRSAQVSVNKNHAKKFTLSNPPRDANKVPREMSMPFRPMLAKY